ncbi:hypothetical protein DSO57_1003147 [Entomophthora muscae]|uniref:Uncharacterized protein n=1 Tax=Entomophthora muscae TaxID=34485 RepID=A0ACC2RND9_9FUNG|nr:hypothetical protein DSO57_1003147 [Entomophthora muscae]
MPSNILVVLPKPLLTGALESLYFEDQVSLRLVCREWNLIIEPFLLCLKTNGDLSIRFMKKMGRFMIQKSLGYKILEDLNTIKNSWPNIKCLKINPCDNFPALLVSKLLEYFAGVGVSISLRGDACSLTDPVFTLSNLNQPQLKELDFGFPKEQRDVIEVSLAVICDKFKYLEKLHLWLGDFNGNISKVFPNIRSLKTLCLKIDSCQGNLDYLSSEIFLQHLVLYEKTYQILLEKCPLLCLNGIKEVDLDIYESICPHIESMFPDLESLNLHQDTFQDEGKPETLHSYGPIGVLNLNITIAAPEFKFNSLEIWSCVIKLSIKCDSFEAVYSVLEWIFTCFPNVVCLTLSLPKRFSRRITQLQFLETKKQVSLKKLLAMKRCH